MSLELEECLRRLGRDPGEPSEATELAGGASGSRVVLIRLGDEDVVLKATTAREAAFYATAADLPVRVPRVLAADGTCLLLEAHTPLPPAADWPAARWHEVARQLGALHRVAIGDRPWLKPAPPARRPDATARAFWTTDELARLDDLDETDLPRCLVHGDLHAGNLLHDAAGELIWVDWQEVGIGAGPEDLALLWQRAEYDGADPPRTAMLSTYAAARGIPDDDTLAGAAAAAEIRLLLLDWPRFLTEPSRAEVMRRRLHAIRPAPAPPGHR